MAASTFDLVGYLRRGQLIPALPLALTSRRRWDERYQQALVRYYIDAGAGGLAVGVHSTQFEIRDPGIDLYRPVLALAAETSARWNASVGRPWVLVAGLCGRTPQAKAEARLAQGLGYHAGLLSLGAWERDSESRILAHCRAVASEIPLIGFYLQNAVGGRLLSFRFWRSFADIPGVVGIKIAPFNRYRTIDVVRAVMASGRDDIALYTGNDDNIIGDLLTPFRFGGRTRFIDGGLLGQWGVWTRAASLLFAEIRKARLDERQGPDWWRRNVELTDANAAVFDAANGFAGCLPGIHEVLRRQGLLRSNVCLDRKARLSPGQAAELTRVGRDYPWLVDDEFVAANVERWLA
jgi:dihydrodipicolinate synthase/N-acetylneuraminate lyase